MRLHEEYIRRHNLTTPVVYYDQRSVGFLRSKFSPRRWWIISITWQSGGAHPGWFVTNCVRPLHNGSQCSRLLESTDLEQRVDWENYEIHVLRIVNSLKKDFEFVPYKERWMAAWEMFLLMSDSCLVDLKDETLHRFIWNSVDQRLSLKIRESNIQNAVDVIGCRSPSLHETWTYQVRPLAKNYSTWLERLFK